MVDPYAIDAEFYDLLHPDNGDDADFWLSLAGAAEGPIVEAGTGTGRIALRLAGAGHRVVGIDPSDAMLAKARAKADEAGLDVQFAFGSLTTLGTLPRDEFGLVIVGDPIQPEIGAIERSLRANLLGLVIDEGPAVDLAFHCGYVIRSTRSDSAPDLVERADLALSAARTTRTHAPVAYQAGMRSALIAPLRSEADLREALDEERLLVHYQPVIDLARATITGVEALVRLRSA